MTLMHDWKGVKKEEHVSLANAVVAPCMDGLRKVLFDLG
jgi:hypothetical protein